MHDFAVKDLMVTVLPEAADECLEGGATAPREECEQNCGTCKDQSAEPTEANTGDSCNQSQATARDFRMLDRELRRILDQS